MFIEIFNWCPSSAVNGVLVVFLRVNILASHRCDPTRVRSPCLTVVVCDKVRRSPAWTRGFSPGTRGSYHTNCPLGLASMPTRYINISCRTCLSIFVKLIKFNSMFSLLLSPNKDHSFKYNLLFKTCN